jgi:hypothetical protein
LIPELLTKPMRDDADTEVEALTVMLARSSDLVEP